MGYKMPIVCKEVYLPFDFAADDYNYTIEEYKEKFGIDLRDIFTIIGTKVVLKNNIKLFTIFLNDVGANYNLAQPVLAITTEGQHAVCNKFISQYTFGIQIDAGATKMLKCGFYDNN